MSEAIWSEQEYKLMEAKEKTHGPEVSAIRTFETGANRNSDSGKLDYEGFLSPLVLQRFAEYMHKHRALADGSLRDSDNWQKGIPIIAYMKSAWRHFFDWWAHHRQSPGVSRTEPLEDALCGVLFNASGYLHEVLKAKHAERTPIDEFLINGPSDIGCDKRELARITARECPF